MAKVKSNGVIGTLTGSLPDDRPVTALQVVESASKCPQGFWPIGRTHDEDSDADLWRQAVVFGKKTTRYLCISKSEGLPGCVIEELSVIGEREAPPAGYSVLGRTADSSAKAWRKRQLCYRMAKATRGSGGAVTDVIVCSRIKKAPDGFIYAGEINGMTLCYKVGSPSAENSPAHRPNASITSPEIKNGSHDCSYENVISSNGVILTPDANRRLRSVPERPPKTTALVSELNRLNLNNRGPKSKTNSQYPNLDTSKENDHDYEALNPSYVIQPSRPAPKPPGSKVLSPQIAPKSGPCHKRAPAPPPPKSSSSYSAYTLGGYNGIEGVPFALNPKLSGFAGDIVGTLPVIKKKTLKELDRLYSYDFRTEHQM